MQPQGPYATAPQRPANTETYPIRVLIGVLTKLLCTFPPNCVFELNISSPYIGIRLLSLITSSVVSKGCQPSNVPSERAVAIQNLRPNTPLSSQYCILH